MLKLPTTTFIKKINNNLELIWIQLDTTKAIKASLSAHYTPFK